MNIKELTTLDEIVAHYPLITQLYPTLTLEQYTSNIREMLPNNHYIQVAAFENDTCLGLCGCWTGTKMWCGKYIEIDNLVVAETHRSKGIGKLLFDYITEKATKERCSMIALDSYVTNFKAHKFFYNDGFTPKGFHFIKILHQEMLH